MTYPFVPAGAPDYGVRRGPALGLLYHMAEGGNTVAYLSHKGVARGVSVHAVCEYSGRVVQMLDWDRASGSLNPRDTSTDKAYFGHSTLVDVLGGWHVDPNSAVLSMEIEGFAATGPNHAQIDGAVAWGEDMKSLFSTLRGAIGHADQTDTKGCPGSTLAMRLVFEGVGGHGLWHPQGGPQQPGDTMGPKFTPIVGNHIGTATVTAAKADIIATTDGTLSPVRLGQAIPVYELVTVQDGAHAGQQAYLVLKDNKQSALLLTALASFAPTVPPTPDCDAAVNAALDHVAGPAAAVSAAIEEARPR